MQSTIIKRGIAIFSIIMLVIIASVACNVITSRDTEPQISNPDETFLTFNGINITNQMLFDHLKSRDGLTHLINYIDEQLLADYMADVTQEEIDEAIMEQIYGTTDQALIDLMTDAEIEELEQDFYDAMLFRGFNPEDDDSVQAFFRLSLAQEAYTAEQFLTTDPDSEFYVTLDDLAAFYDDYKQGDLVAIPLRFFDVTERDNVFNRFNLVGDFEGGFALYTGEEPIEDITRDDLDEDNTQILDDDEVLHYFILIYNYLNQHRDPIDPDATREEIVGLENPHLMYNQFELQRLAAERQTEDFTAFTDMSNYLYHTLRDREKDYSITARRLGGERFYFYAVQYEDVPDFDDLDINEDIPALRDEYVQTLVGDNRIQQAMLSLHERNNVQIHDSNIALAYTMQSGRDFHSENGDNLVATLDTFTIHVDDYFDYMVERVGAVYGMQIAKVEYMFTTTIFEEVYGARRDVWNNRSDMMARHRNDLREEKSLFGGGAYQMFGISPQVFTWDEYLFLFGAAQPIRQQFQRIYGGHPLQRYNFTENDNFYSEEDILRTMVERTLRFDLAVEHSTIADYMPMVETHFDNYFSLNVREIYVFFDLNDDWSATPLEDYLDTLDEQEKDEFDVLMSQFYNRLRARVVDEEEKMEDIVKEYMRASRVDDDEDEDYSEWAVFRNLGLRLEYVDLSRGGQVSLNYQNTRGEDEAFIETLQDLYDRYTTEEYEDEDFLLNDSLTRTIDGLRFMRVQPGTGFEKPSARHTLEDDGEDFDTRLENENDLPTVDQMRLYSDMLVKQRRGETPDIEFTDSLLAALEVYYQPTLNRLVADFNFSRIMIDIMKDGGLQFTSDHATHIERLELLQDLYTRRLFPELD